MTEGIIKGGSKGERGECRESVKGEGKGVIQGREAKLGRGL